MNRIQHSQYFSHMLWNAGNPFSCSSSFLPPHPSLISMPPPLPLFAPVSARVEPLYRRGILGRASKAFIMGFAVLYYTGKQRATHAWPLTSLWSSAIHEKRGALACLYIPGLILYQEKVNGGGKTRGKSEEGRRKLCLIMQIESIRCFFMPVHL